MTKGKTKVYYNIILRNTSNIYNLITSKYFRLVIFEVVVMLYVELPDYFIDCFSIVTGRDASQSKGWHFLFFRKCIVNTPPEDLGG